MYRKILSWLLPGIFLFYSAGIVNITVESNKTDTACQMNKSCSCCSKGSSASCCTGSTNYSEGLDIPCNHPGFEGINFHLDPQVIYSPVVEPVPVFYETYSGFYYLSIFPPDEDDLIKPPQA